MKPKQTSTHSKVRQLSKEFCLEHNRNGTVSHGATAVVKIKIKSAHGHRTILRIYRRENEEDAAELKRWHGNTRKMANSSHII